MSDGGGDVSLLELFREEVRAHCQALSDGLITLEQQPGNARLIETLMRAAHSVKGAARVVALDPAVQLAHTMEELLVRAQNKQITLGDPTKGTFAQLVKAAEKCPARCIHPGQPLNPNEPKLGVRLSAACPRRSRHALPWTRWCVLKVRGSRGEAER